MGSGLRFLFLLLRSCISLLYPTLTVTVAAGNLWHYRAPTRRRRSKRGADLVGPYPQQHRFSGKDDYPAMTPTQLHCSTTYPNDSTHHTDHNTQFNHTSVPTLQLFSTILLQQLLSTDHHLPSTSPSITFTSTPFHVTDDPNEFHFFHFCQSTATTSLFSLHTQISSVLPLRFSLLRLYTFSYPT